MKQLAALLLFCSVMCGGWTAEAQPIRPFRFEPRLEAPLVAAGTLLWLTTEQLKPRIAPAECRICAVDGFDAGGQQLLRWRSYEVAHRASDVLLFGIVPMATLGGGVAVALSQGTPHAALVDAMVMVEALVLTANVTQAVKFAVGRARPYVVTQREEQRDFVASPDDHLSFFSGHTSSTFALAVAAGTTASLRGYRAAPVMWALGVPLAALTGYLRLAADRHYVLDVVAGAVVGSAIGVLIPWLHARPALAAAPAMSIHPPASLSLTWVR